MDRSSRWLFAASLVLCGATLAHVGCGKSGNGTSSGPLVVANGDQPASESAPPDIKKGMKITFRIISENQQNKNLPVLEVRGKWLRLEESGKPYWFNADSFVWYEVQ